MGVPVVGCADVDDFIRECKRELLFLYGSFPNGKITVYLPGSSTALEPDDPVPDTKTEEEALTIVVSNTRGIDSLTEGNQMEIDYDWS